MEEFTKILLTRVPLLSLLLSTIVAWLLMPVMEGLPMVAFFIFFVGLSTLVCILRKDRSWFDIFLYIGILVLSCFLLLRANEVLLFINGMLLLLFGSLLILPLSREHTLINLLTTPFSVINESLTGKNNFLYSWKLLRRFHNTDSFIKWLPTILITLLFVGVTIPLLASANPFFNNLVQDVLRFFDLTQLIQFFRGNELFYLLFRLIALVFLAYVIPRILTASHVGVKTTAKHGSLPVTYLVPKIAMGVLLVIFFFTQAQLYFASPEVLQAMGYTNSRLTNEVFFQVTIVAFIIFFLTYLDKERKTWNKALTYFLILESFFLVGIAFKSVYDYSFLWGFTQKRLWGYATMTWLSGALLLYLYHFVKQTPVVTYFRSTIAYTIVVLIGVNLANFDYLIAHTSRTRLPSGTDYVYLAKRSPDAHFYKETLSNLTEQIEQSDVRESEKQLAAYNLLRKIDGLKRKYSESIPLNSFNYAEYQEYLSVRDVSTEAFRKRLQDVEQKFMQQEEANTEQPPAPGYDQYQ